MTRVFTVESTVTSKTTKSQEFTTKCPSITGSYTLLPNYLLWKPSIIITGIHMIGFDTARPFSNIYTIETERVWSGELSRHKL